MVKQILIDGLRSIEAAGIRNFKKEHIDIIYRDLNKIGDLEFRKIISEYIELDFPPKSLTGFFLKRHRENKTIQKIEDETGSAGVATGEYTHEDQQLYMICVSRATQVFRGNDYKFWMNNFNKNFEELTGAALTEFLRKQKKELMPGGY